MNCLVLLGLLGLQLLLWGQQRSVEGAWLSLQCLYCDCLGNKLDVAQWSSEGRGRTCSAMVEASSNATAAQNVQEYMELQMPLHEAAVSMSASESYCSRQIMQQHSYPRPGLDAAPTHLHSVEPLAGEAPHLPFKLAQCACSDA